MDKKLHTLALTFGLLTISLGTTGCHNQQQAQLPPPGDIYIDVQLPPPTIIEREIIVQVPAEREIVPDGPSAPDTTPTSQTPDVVAETPVEEPEVEPAEEDVEESEEETEGTPEAAEPAVTGSEDVARTPESDDAGDETAGDEGSEEAPAGVTDAIVTDMPEADETASSLPVLDV